MLLRVNAALLMTVFLAGCGKPSQTSPPASAPAIEPPQTTVAVPAADQTPVADGADLAAALAELTQALRKYSFEHRRLPGTLDEVIAAGYVKNLPPAPAGKKLAIDSKTVQVVLVKQ